MVESSQVRKLWLSRDDGARVYVRALGRRDAREPALLILDGIGCAGWAFRKIAPAIAKQRRVVLVHYRGHGRSPTPPRPWHLGMHTLADDAAAACDAVGVERVVALGFSMGFQVALEFYRRHHERTAGLVSLAGPPGQPLASFRGTDSFALALPFVVAATKLASQLTTRVWRSILPSEPARDLGLRWEVNRARIDSRDFELYLRGMADIAPELFAAMLEQAHRHCADDLLPRIRVPTLVVAGARDRFVPASRLREMAAAIPGASFEVLDEATHALPAEYPGEVAERIAAFMGRLEHATPVHLHARAGSREGIEQTHSPTTSASDPGDARP
jgi:pimeloyl-ACP methyl ester carboxylesterase